ncbi:hypothetical protein [Streptomyces zingiberis]|nr:hypothetical protein [Streptomyces zingiberis]
MPASRVKLRTTATAVTMTAALLIGFGAGTANAADWPPLQEGAYLYSGVSGTGTEIEVDLGDLGTCHTLPQAVRSLQIANGSAAVELYQGGDCTGAAWRSGSLTRANLPQPALSYRVVPA